MGESRLNSALVFIGALVSSTLLVLVLQTTTWGQQFFWGALVVGLPGLQGVLTAKSALTYYRQTQSSKCILITEFISASLLILVTFAILVALIKTSSFIALYLGWIVAAIATVPLIITGAIEAIKAWITKRYQRRNTVRVVLNCLIFLFYCGLLVTFNLLALLSLPGEPSHIMGN